MITLPLATLKTALAGLGKIPFARCTLPIIGKHVHVRQADGVLTLTVTDLDTVLRYRHPTRPPALTGLAQMLAKLRDTQEACEFLVPVEELRQAAKSADRDSIVLLGVNAISSVTGGSAIVQEFEPPPLAEYLASAPLDTTPQAIADSVRDDILAAFAVASTDETRYVLNGVYLDVSDPKCHAVVATDGRRLFRANSMRFDAIAGSFVMPSAARIAGSPLAAHPWTLRTGFDKKENRVDRFQIDAGPWTLTGKTVSGNFPNYRQVVPSDKEMKITVVFDEAARLRLLATLPKLPVANGFVRLEVSKECVAFTVGKHRTEIPAAADGKLKIAFSVEYFLAALRMGFRTMRLRDPLTAGIFTEGSRTYVLMPVNTEPKIVPAKVESPTVELKK